MGAIPANFRYTTEHEWLKDEGSGKARVGITDYAQHELGDIVFVDLPEVGKTVKKGEALSSVESVKAVSDIYAPVDGKIVEVNALLQDKPETINQDPHQTGWIAVIEVSNASQVSSLLTSDAYSSHVAQISK